METKVIKNQSKEYIKSIVEKVKSIKLKSNQEIICVFDTETTGTAWNEMERRNKNSDHVAKIIEYGAKYGIKTINEDGTINIEPAIDEDTKEQLGFRIFVNPWLDNHKKFPINMPEIPFSIHFTSKKFLEGNDIMSNSGEKLEKPAESLIKIENNESLIEIIIESQNIASEIIAHNARFDNGMINAAINDVNKLYKSEHNEINKDLRKEINELKANMKKLEKKKTIENEKDIEAQILEYKLLIDEKTKSIVPLKIVNGYKNRVLDTLTLFQEKYPISLQIAMQGKDGKQIVNHKQDTMMEMFLEGEDKKRDHHGAEFDANLLFKVLKKMYERDINKEIILKRELNNVKYVDNFALSKDIKSEYEIDIEVLNTAIRLKAEDKEIDFDVVKKEDLKSQAKNYLYMLNSRKKSFVGYAAEVQIENSYKELEGFVYKIMNANKNISLQELNEKVQAKYSKTKTIQKNKEEINKKIKELEKKRRKDEKLKDFLIRIKKGEKEIERNIYSKLNKYLEEAKSDTFDNGIVLLMFNYLKYEIDQKIYKKAIDKNNKIIEEELKKIENKVNVDENDIFTYFRTHASIPPKESTEFKIIGSISNYKKLLKESADKGIKELTLMDANSIVEQPYVNKELKTYNENNPDDKMQINYGYTTLLKINYKENKKIKSRFIEINIVAKNEQGIKDLGKIMSRSYDNLKNKDGEQVYTDPFLLLSDLKDSYLFKNMKYTTGSYKGIVESVLFDPSIHRDDKKGIIFNLCSKIIEETGEITIELYECDILLNEYKNNLYKSLKKHFKNANINKVFTNPLLNLEGDEDVQEIRNLGLMKEKKEKEKNKKGQENEINQEIINEEDIELEEVENIKREETKEDISEYNIYRKKTNHSVKLIEVEHVKNNDFLDLNTFVEKNELPKNEVVIPDFITDIDELKRWNPVQYKKIIDRPVLFNIEDKSKENMKIMQEDYLWLEIEEGFKKRLDILKLSKEEEYIYKEQLKHEYKVINKMGFTGYTLIVQDFIRTLKDDIKGESGTGRGSAAGSLVSYCLEITDIDPMPLGLLFERYLNPERVSLPDIDMDMGKMINIKDFMENGTMEQGFKDLVYKKYILDDKIDEKEDYFYKYEEVNAKDLLTLYVAYKLGEDTVVNIVTRGTYQPKSAIAEITNVLGNEYVKKAGFSFPNEKNDYIGFRKMILGSDFDDIASNFSNVMTKLSDEEIKEIYENGDKYHYSERFMNLYNTNNEIKRVIDLAVKLEGTIKNYGVHAAGVCILNKSDNFYGLSRMNIGGVSTTAIDSKYIEKLVAIKFDFLGLLTLAQIEGTLQEIKRNRGIEEYQKVTLSMKDEKKIYKDKSIYNYIYKNKNCHGVAQVASEGLQEMLYKMQPDSFEEIVAALALYRPGPMKSGMVDMFIDNKKEKSKIVFEFEELKDVLGETYGTIVFQEQVMKIVQVIGGFTLGGADMVRRGMGKKDIKLLEELKSEFIEGAKNKFKNYDSELIAKKTNDLFDTILKFAGYGFNKSHSAAYGLVSMKTAYLKTHYTKEFFTSLLNTNDNVEKYEATINDMLKNNVEIKGADINKSNYLFSMIDNEVIYGIDAIKGVRSDDAKRLIHIRERDGEFKDFEDFLKRTKFGNNHIGITKASVESLIKSGALDKLEINDNGIILEGINTDVINNKIKDFKELKNSNDRAIKRYIYLMLDTNSKPKKEEKEKIEDNYKKELSYLHNAILEHEVTGSYANIHNPLLNEKINKSIEKNIGMEIPNLDILKGDLKREGKITVKALISKISIDQEYREYINIEYKDVNGYPKKAYFSKSQIDSYLDNINKGDLVLLDLEINQDSNDMEKYYVKLSKIKKFDEENNWQLIDVLEAERLNFDDIDKKEIDKKIDDLGIEKLKPKFKTIEEIMDFYENNNPKKQIDCVLFLKSARLVETKSSGKINTRIELTDGKDKIEIPYWRELENIEELEENVNLPIIINFSGKNPKFPLLSGGFVDPIVLGKDVVKEASLKKLEDDFVVAKNAEPINIKRIKEQKEESLKRNKEVIIEVNNIEEENTENKKIKLEKKEQKVDKYYERIKIISKREEIIKEHNNVKSNAINAMRVFSDDFNSLSKKYHFGNPFGTKSYGKNATVHTDLDGIEVSKMYGEWLNNEETTPERKKQLKGLEYKNIEPERREWINEVINAGRLNNKDFIYFKDTNELTHVKVLIDIIEERKKQKKEEKIKKEIKENSEDLKIKEKENKDVSNEEEIQIEEKEMKKYQKNELLEIISDSFSIKDIDFKKINEIILKNEVLNIKNQTVFGKLIDLSISNKNPNDYIITIFDKNNETNVDGLEIKINRSTLNKLVIFENKENNTNISIEEYLERIKENDFLRLNGTMIKYKNNKTTFFYINDFEKLEKIENMNMIDLNLLKFFGRTKLRYGGVIKYVSIEVIETILNNYEKFYDSLNEEKKKVIVNIGEELLSHKLEDIEKIKKSYSKLINENLISVDNNNTIINEEKLNSLKLNVLFKNDIEYIMEEEKLKQTKQKNKQD